jgi:hypothetical protein
MCQARGETYRGGGVKFKDFSELGDQVSKLIIRKFDTKKKAKSPQRHPNMQESHSRVLVNTGSHKKLGTVSGSYQSEPSGTVGHSCKKCADDFSVYIWVCLGIFGYVWVCLGMFECGWVCLNVFGLIQESTQASVTARVRVR